MNIRVIIADDDKFFRIGLKSELNTYEDIEITGEAINGDQLMSLLRSKPADILLLDLGMPKISGMEVLGLLREESVGMHTIIISGNDDERAILKALQAGAQGFFVKGCDIDTPEIYNAISTVMNGKFYFNEVTHSVLLDGSNRRTVEEPLKVEFSAMELDIIRFISRELTSEQIAEKTHYTKRSLENIRQELIHRVGARTSIGLVLYAIKHRHIHVEVFHAEKV